MLAVNIITYNHEKWIGECLDSVLEQETNFDFIIRIFEDCSTDNTAEICRQYKKKYPNKIELYCSDVNLGAERNVLRSYDNIQNYSYVVNIEGDDYIVNSKRFQMQVDVLEKHKDCSLCSGITIFTMSTREQILRLDLNNVSHIASKYRVAALYNGGIYHKSYIAKSYDHILFSYIATRIIRTSCIHIDKDNPAFFLTDITQLYELLQQGNIFHFKEIFSVSRATGFGIYSSLNCINKMKFVVDTFSEYNRYTNGQFEKNMLVHIADNALLYSNAGHYKKPRKYKNIVKKIRRYFIPRFVLDIFEIPRNTIRFCRRKFNKNKSKIDKIKYYT